MITVSLELDRLDAVGPIATALRDQASKLRAQADNLEAAADQVIAAGEAEVMKLARPRALSAAEVHDRITVGVAPDPRTGGVAMSDDDVDALVQSTGPQPGQSGPPPVVVTPTTPGPGAATAPASLDDDGLPGHVELIDIEH